MVGIACLRPLLALIETLSFVEASLLGNVRRILLVVRDAMEYHLRIAQITAATQLVGTVKHLLGIGHWPLAARLEAVRAQRHFFGRFRILGQRPETEGIPGAKLTH